MLPGTKPTIELLWDADYLIMKNAPDIRFGRAFKFHQSSDKNHYAMFGSNVSRLAVLDRPEVITMSSLEEAQSYVFEKVKEVFPGCEVTVHIVRRCVRCKHNIEDLPKTRVRCNGCTNKLSGGTGWQ